MSSRDVEASLALAGLGIAGYLTVVHYAPGQVPLVCASSGAIDCARVTTSAASSVGPVPVAILGVVWFAGALALLAADGRVSADLTMVRLFWVSAGLLVVFYLVYAELFLVGAICLWCTAVHALVIALFLMALNDYAGRGHRA